MEASKPILYSYFRSTCSWRVRNVLECKMIDYEYRAVNLAAKEQESEEYKASNAMHQVPMFIDAGEKLVQSLSIMEYLEEKYPDLPLLPKDLILRAKVREIMELIASGIQPLQSSSAFQKLEEDRRVDWVQFFIKKGFVALEKTLMKSSGKYCVGDTLTLADCCLVPQVFFAKWYKVDMTPFPTIVRIDQELLKLESFQRASYSKQPDYPKDFPPFNPLLMK